MEKMKTIIPPTNIRENKIAEKVKTLRLIEVLVF